MKRAKIEDTRIIEVPQIRDRRGNLAVIEKEVLPFEMQRVYYLFDVPSGSRRGGHAHKTLSQFLIATSGSFEVVLKDGTTTKRILLNNPSKGLLIVPGIWRELENFSAGAVCMVVASDIYKPQDYIASFREYKAYNKED